MSRHEPAPARIRFRAEQVLSASTLGAAGWRIAFALRPDRDARPACGSAVAALSRLVPNAPSWKREPETPFLHARPQGMPIRVIALHGFRAAPTSSAAADSSALLCRCAVDSIRTENQGPLSPSSNGWQPLRRMRDLLSWEPFRELEPFLIS